MSDALEILLSLSSLGSSDRFQVTSPKTARYNCIAWAATEESRCWWPDRMKIGYWPKSVPRVETLTAFKQAYETVGYLECENGDSEPGYEKIAIFAKPAGTPAHAARQLPNGRWTSKLGKGCDIEHELTGLECSQYGKVTAFMKRPRCGLSQ